LLDVAGLVRHFPLPRAGFLEAGGVLHALDGVDLRVIRETVGLVVNQVSGKSTLAGWSCGWMRRPRGQSVCGPGHHAGVADIHPSVAGRMQMIFQDPSASLNRA